MTSISSVPVWVKWLAQDASGQWWGYSIEPLQADNHWYENEVGRYVRLKKEAPNPNWPDTLKKA